MKCFQCKKKILDKDKHIHIGDADFVHTDCKNEYEYQKEEFFKNIGDEKFYNKWLTKSE